MSLLNCNKLLYLVVYHRFELIFYKGQTKTFPGARGVGGLKKKDQDLSIRILNNV